MRPTPWSREPGSFRDPSGFVFTSDGTVYRQVNRVFEAEYRRFIDSGLVPGARDCGSAGVARRGRRAPG